MVLQWRNRFFVKLKSQLKFLIPEQKQNKTYIIPTKFGFFFSVIILVLLYTSFASGNNFLYLYTFFLTSVGVTTLRLTNENISAIKIESVEIQEVFAGSPAYANVNLFNSSSQVKSFIEVYHDAKIITTVPEIAANSAYQARIELKPFLRGRHPLPRIILSTTYPFYLLNSWKVFRSKETFVVFPAQVGEAQLPFYEKLHESVDNNLVHQRNSPDSEFTGHRKFEVGDSFRQVDWKAFARTEKLLVKDYQSFRAQEVDLRWSNTAAHLNLELRLSQLALWIEIAESKGFHYSLEIPGKVFEIQRGRSHYLKCLTALGLFGKDQNLAT